MTGTEATRQRTERSGHAAGSEPEAPPERAPAAARRLGRRGGLSIQSKLLVMLLAVSLLATTIVGAIGYLSGRDSLRAAAIEKLTTIREMRTGVMEAAVMSVEQSVGLNSRNLSAQQASQAFNAGYAEAASAELSAADAARLEAFHAERFIPELRERTGEDYGARAFLPESAAGRYLQAHYSAQATDFDEALTVEDAGDGSAWSAAHARYHDYFQRLIETLGYEDLLLLDTDANVVYTAYSGVELGANLGSGPLRETKLAAAYQEVLATNSVTAVATTDFERWAPSLGQPTMWVLSPVGNDERITGVLAAQLPAERITEVLTGGGQWASQGLGETGEVYVVGPDGLMRSNSRLLAEDPEAFAAAARRGGTPGSTVDRILEVGGTVLLQPVDSEAVRRATEGLTGVAEGRSYTGRDSIMAYTPIELGGLDWVGVASVETAEAYAPVAVFTRNLVLATLGILLGVTLLSMLFAQVFSRPVRRLAGAVREVAAGDYDVRVPAQGRDEFAELGAAFNDMSSSLRVKEALIEEQRDEYDSLLHTMMPEPMARRFRDGEETIALDHQDVSVVFAELVGVDQLARGRSSAEELQLVNGLMRSFDEAVDRIGAEKVRTLRDAYLVSSGLVVPRVDNVRRAVEVAIELRGCVERFNAQHDADLAVRIGVDTGTVTSGLVGRTGLAYDLWGDAVNLAHLVQDAAGAPGIYLSQAVCDRLQDTVPLERVGSVETPAGSQPVWKVR